MNRTITPPKTGLVNIVVDNRFCIFTSSHNDSIFLGNAIVNLLLQLNPVFRAWGKYQMEKKSVFSYLLVLGLMFISCTGSSNDNSVSPLKQTGSNRPYFVSGDTILIISPDGNYTSCENNNILRSAADTLIYKFVISHDTLKIGTPSNSTTLTGYSLQDPNAIVDIAFVFCRAGTGSGLIGTWDMRGFGFLLTRGTLSASEQAYFDTVKINSPYNFKGIHWEFTTNQCDIYKSISNVDYYFFNGPQPYIDTNSFFGTVSRVNDNSIRFQGNVTQEIVTITFTDNGDVTYSSNIASHPAKTVFTKPSQCPNLIPDWFDAFVSANVRSMSQTGLSKHSITVPPKQFDKQNILQKMKSMRDIFAGFN